MQLPGPTNRIGKRIILSIVRQGVKNSVLSDYETCVHIQYMIDYTMTMLCIAITDEGS